MPGLGALPGELRSVNAKGLDARLRLPPPFDAIEPEARARVSRKLNRGTIYATLAAQPEAAIPEVRINQDVLRKLIAAVAEIPPPAMITPATFDGLLALRGVVEISDAAENEAEILKARVDALGLLDAALELLVAMRQSEGGALALVLSARLEKIAALTQAADACPARKPEAIQARLAQSLAILSGNANFDQIRLHQEALMLAAKADIREELDRLAAHTDAARELLAKGGAAGRRLRLPCPRTFARGQYAVRQVERREPDGARPRIARRDRAIPRTGTKYRVKICRKKKQRPRESRRLAGAA